MNKPLFLTGLFMILSVLYTPIHAEDVFEYVPYPKIVEVEQPDWLDYKNGQVSFKGGELTTDEEQHEFAKRYNIPFTRTWGEYDDLIEAGKLVRFDTSKVSVTASMPYVLESTANFTYELAEDFAAANCGRLTVTGGGRLTTRPPINGSPFSVHPAGMAVDLRIIKMSRRCKNVLRSLLRTAEAEGRADTTEERWPPHMHVVVIPPLPTTKVVVHQETGTGQGF